MVFPIFNQIELAKISCSNYGYRQWKLAEVIPNISKIGYRAIEIVTHGLGWPMGYHLTSDFDDEYMEGLKETLAANNMQVACISPDNNFWIPTGSKEAEVNHVNREIDLAEKFGAQCVRIQATSLKDIPEGISRSAFIQTIAEPMAKCVDHGKTQGVKLAIETHSGFWANDPDNMKDLLSAVGSDYLGICLHTFVDSPKIVSTLGDRIFHLHLSEFSSMARRSSQISELKKQGIHRLDIMKKLNINGKQFEEALAWKPREIPLGEGEIDFKAIFKGLKDHGYSGWWNFEGHSTIDPEEDARKSYAYINELLRGIGLL